jgi:hypothetical protein
MEVEISSREERTLSDYGGSGFSENTKEREVVFSG